MSNTIVILFAIFGLLNDAWAYPIDVSSQSMRDPIFDIEYSTKIVKFQSGEYLRKPCGILSMEAVWVYANAISGDDKYFILSGLVIPEKEEMLARGMPPVLEPDLTGAVAKLNSSGCKLGDLESVFSGQIEGLSVDQMVQKKLALDLLLRYDIAFGGAAQLNKILGTVEVDLSYLGEFGLELYRQLGARKIKRYPLPITHE